MSISAPSPSPRTALILSDAWNEGRARLLREGRVLRKAGIAVTVAGVSRGAPLPPDWSVIDNLGRGMTAVSSLHRGRSALLWSSRFSRKAAEAGYWSTPAVRSMREFLLSGPTFDLVIAHNWQTLPLGVALKRDWGSRLIADFHEYAIGENMERPTWVRFIRPYIKRLLDIYLPECDLITAVSAGIARQMAVDHGLAETPMVVRNIPAHEAVEYDAPAADDIEVLYLGNIVPHRGLEEILRSIPRWDPKFRFSLRGVSPRGYRSKLEELARELNIAHRIAFEPAVPREDLLQTAARADIGIFVIEGESAQRQYVQPNKFFEYILANLALCVSDLPEMAPLVAEHDLGVLVPRLTPDAIADAVNRFDADSVARFRENSRRASQELNWEKEGEKLSSAYRALGL